MESLETNTVVIGGGPGGYPAAIRLGQLGISTILIEKEKMGGTCLNIGCIPSKALLNASGTYAQLNSEIADMGIQIQNATIHWEETIAWKDKLVQKLVQGIQGLLQNNNVRLIKGVGSLLNANQVEVQGEQPALITCKNIILATGSVVVNLKPFPVDNQTILDSTGLLSLKTIPESMILLGGGVIGMELGTVFSNLGCKVTIVEMLENILPNCENEARKIIQKAFEKKGGEILTGTKALECSKILEGVALTVERNGQKQTLSAKLLGVTVGRKPYYEGLNLEGLNLKIQNGRIPVNDQLQTIYPNIYAVGDLIDGPMLAHKATAEGVLAAEIISGEKAFRSDIQVISDVTYTKPEIANAGLLEHQALEKGYTVKVGKFPLSALGRAATTNESAGYIKYVADAENDRIIGVTIVSNHASDLISEAALAIEMAATLDDVALTVHPHPTFSEGHMEAAAAGLKKAIHMFNR
ncbi:dihydrolipoyl dehydrogenase [Deltaproteobacteria bacterium TL4]